MRVHHLAVALIAVVAGAGVVRASMAGRDSNGTPVGPAIPRAMISGAKAISVKPGSSAAGLSLLHRRPNVRPHDFRVGQIMPQGAQEEATTGNPSLPPYKWVGLLVLPDPSPGHPNAIAECTAQFITPKVLITAGHCLRDLASKPTGPWPDVTKGTFWLQYQNQSGIWFNTVCGATSPLYQLPANYGSMTRAQKNAAGLALIQHDVAMILVDGTSPNGVMPYALDWKGKVSWVRRIGYAADILNGQIIQQSGGMIFFADAIPMFDQSYPDMVVQWAPITNLTEGTSGGAWVANASPNEGPNKNILIAVTSSQLVAYPGGEAAAYLTSAEFNPLLQFVSNGCK
jgi:hypothetical protein